ncbi:MAG: 30S ribosomal protein S6 [Elusimicrobiota bacterium]|nr:30S ribosomal protein S6 [Elusimicrobiota bacterium]
MNYETIFIVHPDATQEQQDEILKEVKGILSEKKTAVLAEQNWGKKTLAYEIKKNREGFYYYVKFSSQVSEVPNKLSLYYRRSDPVLKFMTVKLDD